MVVYRFVIIKENTFYSLLNAFPIVPPEAGAILGAINGVVSYFAFDAEMPRQDAAIYTPSTKKLNLIIQEWAEQGISFCGFAHSHPFDQRSLSSNDICYIHCIMNAMPGSIEKLFFPLVFPGETMLSFVANSKQGEVTIEPENIILK